MSIGDKQNCLNLTAVHFVFHPKISTGKLTVELWGRGEKGARWKINWVCNITWIPYLLNSIRDCHKKITDDVAGLIK